VTLEPLPGVAGWRAKDVLLEEVKDDTIVPNSSAERLARAAGLAQVDPVVVPIGGLSDVPAPASVNLASGATGAIFQFAVADGAPVDHGSASSSRTTPSRNTRRSSRARSPGVTARSSTRRRRAEV
jgi:hypothetical protein